MTNVLIYLILLFGTSSIAGVNNDYDVTGNSSSYLSDASIEDSCEDNAEDTSSDTDDDSHIFPGITRAKKYSINEVYTCFHLTPSANTAFQVSIRAPPFNSLHSA